MARVLCLGAGGHAVVILDSLNAMAQCSAVNIAGLAARAPFPSEVLGIPVFEDDGNIAELGRRADADSFIIAVGTVRGGDVLRARMFEAAIAAGLKPFTVIHPHAIISRSAEIMAGTVVMAGAVIQARARIGQNVIVNTRASIDHDCAIGDHVHISPGATLSGGVRVGARCHIGTGACIRDNISIGADATVGVGAAVIQDCRAGATFVGVPARERPSRS